VHWEITSASCRCLNVSGVLYLLGGAVALVTLTGPGARHAREG
jgi:hypothetical protein